MPIFSIKGINMNDVFEKRIIVFRGEEFEREDMLYDNLTLTLTMRALKDNRQCKILFKPFKNKAERDKFDKMFAHTTQPMDAIAYNTSDKNAFIRKENYTEVMVENGFLVYKTNLDEIVKDGDFKTEKADFAH